MDWAGPTSGPPPRNLTPGPKLHELQVSRRVGTQKLPTSEIGGRLVAGGRVVRDAPSLCDFCRGS